MSQELMGKLIEKCCARANWTDVSPCDPGDGGVFLFEDGVVVIKNSEEDGVQIDVSLAYPVYQMNASTGLLKTVSSEELVEDLGVEDVSDEEGS